MKKVVHIAISLEPGGLERLVVDLTNERNKKLPGSTKICCLDSFGKLAEELGDQKEDIVFCLDAKRSKFPWDRRAVQKLRNVISSFKSAASESPLVLHAHNFSAWQYAVLASRGTNARVIYTQHGANPHTSGWFNRLRARLLLRHTANVVAVSNATAEAMSRTLRIPKNRIEVVRNGVKLRDSGCGTQGSVSKLRLRQEWRIPEEAIVIGYVGRLSFEKGVDRLVAGVATMMQDTRYRMQVGEENHAFRFVGTARKSAASDQQQLYLLIVGDGNERKELELQVKALGIADKVVFAGYRSDARNVMKAMDLFVLPSRSEGLPVALLEAMTEGVPVAATDVGECLTVLGDGRYGHILSGNEKNWPGEFLAILAARDDERLQEARARVLSDYSSETMLCAYEKIYSTI